MLLTAFELSLLGQVCLNFRPWIFWTQESLCLQLKFCHNPTFLWGLCGKPATSYVRCLIPFLPEAGFFISLPAPLNLESDPLASLYSQNIRPPIRFGKFGDGIPSLLPTCLHDSDFRFEMLCRLGFPIAWICRFQMNEMLQAFAARSQKALLSATRQYQDGFLALRRAFKALHSSSLRSMETISLSSI